LPRRTASLSARFFANPRRWFHFLVAKRAEVLDNRISTRQPHPPLETFRMRSALLSFALLFVGAGLASAQENPYGPLGGFKLLKPDDAKGQPSVSAPSGAIVLFDGKSLDNWVARDGKSPAKWKLADGGAMQVGGGDIITKEKFDGSFKLHVEFRVPYQPKSGGQGRGNSGVYLQGRYEVQVLDSYGLKSQSNDCGGIYGVATPLVNACKAPTVWQTYDIDYTSPKCDGKNITEPAIITVYHNGQKIHENVRIATKKDGKEDPVKNTTSGLGGDPCAPGPILLQDHGNPVQYRNVWLVKKQ